MYYEKNTHDLYFSEKNMCFTIKKRKKCEKNQRKNSTGFQKNSTGFFAQKKIQPVFDSTGFIWRKNTLPETHF